MSEVRNAAMSRIRESPTVEGASEKAMVSRSGTKGIRSRHTDVLCPTRASGEAKEMNASAQHRSLITRVMDSRDLPISARWYPLVAHPFRDSSEEKS